MRLKICKSLRAASLNSKYTGITKKSAGNRLLLLSPEQMTTMVPPPKLPDEKYMKNLSTPRAPAEFSIAPWRVIERLNDKVHGKDCVHMNPHKTYSKIV